MSVAILADAWPRRERGVVFIARGAHVQALRAQGLRVESVLGDFVVQPVQATDDPRQMGAVVRLGEAVGIATPLHAFIYASLLPWSDGHGASSSSLSKRYMHGRQARRTPALGGGPGAPRPTRRRRQWIALAALPLSREGRRTKRHRGM